jgi:hypothetical protein
MSTVAAIRIGPADHGRAMTLLEFMDAETEEGYRYELARGVMELVSQGSEAHERDYATKREEYLAFGIREYWIVDPVARIVTILARDGDVWVEQIFRDGQKAKSSILAGLEVDTSALWAEPESEANELPGT